MEDLKQNQNAMAVEAKEIIRKMDFSTSDIFWYINDRLDAREIEKYDVFNQKEIVEQELRNYIGYKLEELCESPSKEVLKEKDILLLIDMLSSLKLDNKKEIVDSFTQYIIKIILKLQNIKIEWKLAEVRESTFISINDFEFFFLTPKNYNCLEAFYKIWNFFQSKILDENRKRA